MDHHVDKTEAGGRPARRTFAVLVDWIKDGYQNLIFAGMADAARDADISLVCLAGGIVGSPLKCGAQRNVIYQLASPRTVDGILLMAGTLGNHIGPVELGKFCERFAPLPIISIAVAVADIPTLTIDDAEGMRSAIRHLIAVHGHRRIAFVRGPTVNEEAERRFAAYQEVLSEAGIAFDPELVAPGDFQHDAGVAAMRLLLDERRQTFDAVVAVNDHMIFGVVAELSRRGVRVPDQVAVVGFDDIDEARFGTPSLTTVRQPLYEQGVRAVELLSQLSQGGNSDMALRMKSELIVRRSCGCRQAPDEDAPQPAEVGALPCADGFKGGAAEFLALKQEVLPQQMRRPLGGGAAALPRSWENQLASAWLSDAVHPGEQRFHDTLTPFVDLVAAAGADVGSWQDVISVMRAALMPLLREPTVVARAEMLLHEAREAIAITTERDQARQRLHVGHWARVLSETSEALLNSVDMVSLVKVLEDTLPRFEIPSAYLCLSDQHEGVPRTATLLLAYDRIGRANGTVTSDSLGLWDLIPGAMGPRDRRWTVVVEPLLVANQHLGFILFEVGPREGIIYESLREQISSAINGVRLVEHAVLEAEGRLHGQKLEAIGTLASGVAHELNTPIQYVGDSVSFLVEAMEGYQRVVAGYRKLLGDSPAARALEETEDLAYLSEEAPRAGARSLEGLRRAAAIVAAMKEFSRKDAREQAPADLNRALSNTLEVGRSEYRDWADIDMRLGEIPLVRCYIGEINQVFLNLIVNAAHAIEDVAKRTGKRGTITTRSMLAGDDVIVEIADTGGGIPPEIQGKIFEPFFTTKPVGRGTGQGLAIARSAIIDKHGGNLTFTSDPGVGTVFRLSLPVAGKTQST